jgi:hypothetical protein
MATERNVDDVISRPLLPPTIVPVTPMVPELAKALVAAQKAAKAVSKDARNNHHGYNYASAENIIDEARGALSDAGLAVMPLSVGPDPRFPDHVWSGEGDAAWIITPRRILSTYRLLHESGQSMDFWMSTPVIPEKGRPEDKAEFGSRTENLGYAMRDLLLLPRGTEGADAPSGRDDRDKNLRGPSQGDSKRPPAQLRSEPAAQNGPRPGNAERAMRITNMLTGPKDKGCLEMPKPAAFDWVKARFGKGQANLLSEQQQKDAEELLLAKLEGDKVYRAKVAEFAKAGRCLGDGEVAA